MANSENDGKRSQSPVVLLVSYDHVHFSELLEFARWLRQSGTFRPQMCLTHAYPERDTHVKLCVDSSIPCCDIQGETLAAPKIVAPLNATPSKGAFFRFAAAATRPLRRWLTQCRRKSIVCECLRYRSLIKKSQRLLQNTRPAIVVLAGDHVEDLSGPLTKAAHELDAAVVVTPYTLCTADEAAQSYFDNPLHQLRGIRNRWAARRFPNWTYRFKNRELLRLPAAGILANEWLDISPQSPWVPNSGRYDAMLTESSALTRYWQMAGVATEKLVETGSPVLDRMYDCARDCSARKAELYRKLKFSDANAKLLLCALPFSAFPNRAGHCEFDSYDSLVRFWMQELGVLANWNIVIRLHPRLRLADFKSFETGNIRFCESPTYSLIPLCDLFVASASATIRWANACGKPTLNYDVYRYEYEDYKNAVGVTTVTDKSAFSHALQKLSSDSNACARAASCAADWGRLDGKAGERIAEALARIASRRGAKK